MIDGLDLIEFAEIPDDSTFYLLELDGTELKHTFAGNRLKRFFSRVELDNNRAEAHDTIRIRDALEVDEESQSGDMVIDEGSMEDPEGRCYGGRTGLTGFISDGMFLICFKLR